MTPEIDIRPVAAGDRAAWQALYAGYATFYGRTLAEADAATLWGWLHDPAHEVEGLVAVRGGDLLGLAHFRRVPSPLRARDIGFVDDLFVAEAGRGARVGAALLGEIARIAARRGWPVVRWITADDNYRARTLYDRVARKTAWNTYEMAPDPSG